MKKRTMGLIALLAMMLISCVGTATARAGRADPTLDLRLTMRQLWEEHVMYTRNYIISSFAGLEDADRVAERLFRNSDDIGRAIKPYYGYEAGNKLAGLLRNHVHWTTRVTAELKEGNKADLTPNQSSWVATRHEIAIFLSGANPNWPQEDFETMLQKHLDLTRAEIVGRLNKDWAADIRAYDEGHEHILMFADVLTAGIVKQFPDRFK